MTYSWVTCDFLVGYLWLTHGLFVIFLVGYLWLTYGLLETYLWVASSIYRITWDLLVKY